jgi:hypothetical protein
VVYVADRDVDEVYELFSVPIDGSASPIRLNGPLGANEDVGATWISPGGSWVLFAPIGCTSERRTLCRYPPSIGTLKSSLVPSVL